MNLDSFPNLVGFCFQGHKLKGCSYMGWTIKLLVHLGTVIVDGSCVEIELSMLYFKEYPPEPGT